MSKYHLMRKSLPPGTINSVLIRLGGFIVAEAPIIKTYRSGATGLINSLYKEIGLVEHINQFVTWDEKQWNVSPEQHILALIINTLCGQSLRQDSRPLSAQRLCSSICVRCYNLHLMQSSIRTVNCNHGIHADKALLSRYSSALNLQHLPDFLSKKKAYPAHSEI